MTEVAARFVESLLADAIEGDGTSWFVKDKPPGTAAWMDAYWRGGYAVRHPAWRRPGAQVVA